MPNPQRKMKLRIQKYPDRVDEGLELHYSRSHTPIMIPNYNLLYVVSVEY